MFLPTPGVNRDRTADFIAFKGSDRDIRGDRREADSARLLGEDASAPSVLEPFFQLAGDIKADIKRAQVSLSELLRAQQQCLRPTFADGNDQYQDVVALTASLNAQIREIQKKINFIVPGRHENADRARILQNLRSALTDALKQVSTEVKMAQQTFNASYTRQEQPEDADTGAFDFATLDFGGRQQASLEEAETDEVAELVRRAAEVREIFADVAALVAEQGTVVDRIDCNITEALENADAAHSEIVKAAGYQQKSRMWKCAAVLAVFVAILLTLVVMK